MKKSTTDSLGVVDRNAKLLEFGCGVPNSTRACHVLTYFTSRSEPFFRKVATFPEEIAILVMDTQGMFDNETSMSLTARIFGLSTLISSYQVIDCGLRIGLV